MTSEQLTSGCVVRPALHGARVVLFILIALMSFALAPDTCNAAERQYDRKALVALTYGLNELDLTGNPGSGLVLQTLRYKEIAADRIPERAPGSTQRVIKFFVHEPFYDWLVVPFEFHVDGSGPSALDMTTDQQEKCATRDFRLLVERRGKGRLVRVIRAERASRGAMGSESSVRFTEFRLLREGEEALEIEPPFHFRIDRIWHSERRYCDVNLAFRHELGLPCVDPDMATTPGCAMPKQGPASKQGSARR